MTWGQCKPRKFLSTYVSIEAGHRLSVKNKTPIVLVNGSNKSCSHIKGCLRMCTWVAHDTCTLVIMPLPNPTLNLATLECCSLPDDPLASRYHMPGDIGTVIRSGLYFPCRTFSLYLCSLHLSYTLRDISEIFQADMFWSLLYLPKLALDPKRSCCHQISTVDCVCPKKVEWTC